MKSFELHPQLRQEGILLGKLGICQLLLLNNSSYPWFVLVPEVVEEQVHLMQDADREALFASAQQVASHLDDVYQPTRINVGAIGNVVPQLHYHLVVRYETDQAWPGVVWGAGESVPYQAEQIAEIQATLAPLLKGS